MLVGELTDAFDIKLTAADVVPDNFKSVDSICEMVRRLQDDN